MIGPKQRGTIDIMHERFLKEALKRTKNNRKEAAEMLGISDRNIFRMITKYKLPIKNKPRRT